MINIGEIWRGYLTLLLTQQAILCAHTLNGNISTKPVIMLTDLSYWGENWKSFPEKVEAVRVSDCCKNSRADGY